jgi:hypothetical protein
MARLGMRLKSLRILSLGLMILFRLRVLDAFQPSVSVPNYRCPPEA